MGKKCKCMHFSVIALGVALGLVSGLCMMVFAFVAMHGNYGSEAIKIYMDIFPGYDATARGALVGLGWGFLEGFIMGILVAWIYNLCLCCYRCCCCCCNTHSTVHTDRSSMI